GDVYPYPAGSTKMDNLLPAWMHDGGIAKLLERLADPAARARAIADCLVDGERWRTGSGANGWDEVMVATCSREELAGKTLAELAPPHRTRAGARHDGLRARGEGGREHDQLLPK